MKRIYLLAYITILCCLCPLLKAQLGPMPFTPVPPNDPSLVRLLNSDVRCRQWVDSVMQRLTLKERIGQLFIYTIAPQQDKANKELLRKVVEDYKVGGLLFSGGLMQNQVMLTNEAQRMAEVPLMITFDGEWGLAMRLRGTPNFPRNMVLGCIQNDTLIYEYGREDVYKRQGLYSAHGRWHVAEQEFQEFYPSANSQVRVGRQTLCLQRPWLRAVAAGSGEGDGAADGFVPCP